MAGLGAKLFTAFSKLTAAQVNGYLMDQSIMRFSSSAARDAAFGGAGEPTLAEGMTCYLDDTNVLQSYTGSAWVSVAASSTVADVSSGMVYITSNTFAGSAGVELSNCFTATYDNYEIHTSYYGSAGTNTSWQMMTGTNTKDNSATYTRVGYYYTAGITNFNAAAQNQWFNINHGTTASSPSNSQMTIYKPNVSAVKTESRLRGYSGDSDLTVNIDQYTAATTAYTGIYLFPTTGNITGTVTVYGYRK